MKSYWEKRFIEEGKIWRDNPSSTARHALVRFQSENVRSLLVPGSGYGRNTQVFSSTGMKVVGVEISQTAIEFALQFDSATQFHNISALDIETLDQTFDAIYCFNVLHLFREKERTLFLSNCFSVLRSLGVMYFVVFSDQESSFGKANEVEWNTFESKPGRPVHYFAKEDLLSHFVDFDIIETGLTEDKEIHGKQGEHTHRLRYVLCRKR